MHRRLNVMHRAGHNCAILAELIESGRCAAVAGRRNATMEEPMEHAQTLPLTLRIFIAALVVLSLLLGPTGIQTTQAASGYGYYWKIEFDFEQGVHGLLTVDAGPGEVGAPDKILVSRQYRVACQPVGAVGVAGGVATFNGGYLH
jgi:hypothetical protein